MINNTMWGVGTLLLRLIIGQGCVLIADNPHTRNVPVLLSPTVQVRKLRLRGHMGWRQQSRGLNFGAHDWVVWVNACRAMMPNMEARSILSYRALNLVLKGEGELTA